MNDDPEIARWENAIRETELETVIRETKRLLPELKIVLDIAAEAATKSAHDKELLKQFADEGSKTAAYIVYIWDNEYPALFNRSKVLAALVLKYKTWRI